MVERNKNNIYAKLPNLQNFQNFQNFVTSKLPKLPNFLFPVDLPTYTTIPYLSVYYNVLLRRNVVRFIINFHHKLSSFKNIIYMHIHDFAPDLIWTNVHLPVFVYLCLTPEYRIVKEIILISVNLAVEE